MTLSELLRNRRSCRRFEPRPVGKDLIGKLLEDTLTAPSSRNTRSTRLGVVDDPALLAGLSTLRSTGSAFLKDAPAAIVILADRAATDLWRENASISATILQLSAEAHGLGSCWVHVHGRPHRQDDPSGMQAEDYVRELLKIPADLAILCVIALGYPAVPPHPHREQDDSDKVLHLG